MIGIARFRSQTQILNVLQPFIGTLRSALKPGSKRDARKYTDFVFFVEVGIHDLALYATLSSDKNSS